MTGQTHRVHVRTNLFNDELNVQNKKVDPATLKPVSALDLPDNCIRELDFVQLKTYLAVAIPTGLERHV